MRSFVFSLVEKLNANVVGPAYRQFGKKLYAWGKQFEGENAPEDRLVPSLRKVQHNGKTPQLNDADFIAPNATIIGDVTLGENSSIWYGAAIIGTLPVKIGSNTVIQDRSYVSRQTTIGDFCFIGPNTLLQGANIGNRAFVGMGSTVRHATLQNGSVVAGGAVIVDNVTIKSNELWAGNPAQYVRSITPTERQIMREHLQQMQLLAKIHEEQSNKSFRQLLTEEQTITMQRFQEYINQNLDRLQLPSEHEDWNFVEQRLLMKETSIPEKGRVSEDPYEQDLSKFPEDLQIVGNHPKLAKSKISTQPNWHIKNVDSPYTKKL